jgi:NitT/TauT family transport system substrate-binding protein
MFSKSSLLLAIMAPLILSLALASGACSLRDPPAPAQKLTFGDLGVDSSLFIYIAQQKGYFSKNGLEIVSQNYSTAPQALDALIKSEVDITTAGEFPVVLKVFANESIKIIATTDKFQAFYLVGRTDLGVRSASDLKGKNVGLVKGGLPEFYFGRFIQLRSLTIGDVNLIDLAPAQWLDSIVSGKVDAIVVSQFVLGQVQAQLADKIMVWSVQNNQPGYGTVVLRSEWIDKHPLLVESFLKALEQSEEYMANNPDETRRLLSQKFSYNDSYMNSLWPQHQFALSLDQGLIVAMEDEARWMISNNQTVQKQIPDFVQSVHLDGLKKIKPDAVDIIH